MKITPKNVRKFQEGGAMDTTDQTQDTGMEQPQDQGLGGGGQDPIMMIALAAAQALQNQDCLMALQVCQAFIQLVQQMGQGGGQPEQPVYARRGGKIYRKR